MLRATTACTFSSLIWPAGSAPAALASLLFNLRSHKSLEKHSESRLSVFHDVPSFSRTCIFFLLIFSLLTLLTSAFQLSILSEVSLLNFLRPRNIGNKPSTFNAIFHSVLAKKIMVLLLYILVDTSPCSICIFYSCW